MSIVLFIALLGMIVGLSVGVIGTGSLLAVPLLVYVAHMSVHAAVCVAMIVMTFLGLTGSLQNLRTRAIDFRAASVLAISGALSAPAGAWLNKQMPPSLLLFLFAFVVFAIGIRMLLHHGDSHDESAKLQTHAKRSSVLAGVLIGLLGGTLGISGGFVAVPILTTYTGLEMHRAVATSWFIVAVVSASASIGHFAAGERVPLATTLLFGLGGVVGFEIGLRAREHFSGARLARLFAVAILVLGVFMLGEMVAHNLVR
jgi:uncharacterized membrane protein YfcA